MLQEENQNENENKAQWFLFKVIQEISGIIGDYYLKKYENKIGIIYKGKDCFFMKYYENNQEVSSKVFPYIFPNQSEDDFDCDSSSSFSSYDSDDIESNPYFFCGKLEYLFYIKQQASEIVQCNLKTLICKTYNFEEIPLHQLEFIKGIKKTNYIIMSWIDPDSSESLIEIRDSAEFQIKYQFKLTYIIDKILYTNLQQSQIAITDYVFGEKRIRYYSIREQKLFSLFSYYGKIQSKIIEMENYLILTFTHHTKYELASLILKGKILRKLYQNKMFYRIKKYQNTYLLQVNLSDCSSCQICQWWNGKLEYSSKIKDLLNGKITSRGKKAEKKVYILKYQPEDAQLRLPIPDFQFPLGSCKEIGWKQ